MNNTILKETQLKQFEPALRHILLLNSNEKICFNNKKNRNNAQADIIYFKDTLYYYIKVFPTYSQYGYTVPIEKYCLIHESKDLEYIMLTMNNGFVLIKKADFLNLKYTTKIHNGMKQLHFAMFDENMEPLLNKDSYIFYSDSKTLLHNGKIEYLIKYYSNLSLQDAYLIPDHKLGKLYNLFTLDTDGSIMGLRKADIKGYVDDIYGTTDNDNAKAKDAFNKKLRRFIKKTEKSFELGEKLEPLIDVANGRDIRIYLLPPEMFSTKNDFYEYQNSHEPHKKKTEDMKAYKKEYYESRKDR